LEDFSLDFDLEELGNFSGRLMIASYQVRNLKEEKQRERIEKTLNPARRWFFQRFLPQIINDQNWDELELFYKGLADIIAKSGIGFANVVPLIPDLPGEPALQEIWEVTEEQKKQKIVLTDTNSDQSFLALNDTGKLFLSSLLQKFRQAR
jgi:hypothetical protein